MKKVMFLFLASSFLFPVSAFARDGAIPSIRQEIKENREKNKEARVTKIEERKTTGNQNRLLRAQATMKRLRQGIVNRFENTLKHKTTIEARIAKIGTTRDMTATKAKLATFSTSKYVADLALFDAKVTEILASPTPLKLTPELKTIAKNLQEDIKTMRQTLADTLRLMIKSR